MKNLCQLFIPRLRNAETDILRGKTGQETAQRNKLHFAVVHVDDNTAAEAVVPMHQRIEQRFADGFLGIVLLIRTDDALDGRDCPVAQRQIVDRVFKLLEDRAAKLLAVPELCAGFIVEYGDFCRVLALIGQKQRQIGVLIVVDVPKPQRNILVLQKIHLVSLERDRSFIKGQILLHGAHFFEHVAVRIFDHLPDLFRRRLHTRCALPDVNASGLQSFALQIIRLIAALTDFNADDLVLLQHIAHEHRHIRLNGVADAVCQPRVCLVHIVNAGHISLIVNADIDHTAVSIRKGDDFLVNIICQLGFKFHALVFVLHQSHLRVGYFYYTTFFI